MSITYLDVPSSVPALIRQLHHSCDHSQGQADCKGKKEPAQRLGLQGAPSVPALLKAAGLPPLVTEVVKVTRFAQFEDGHGELLSPLGCWSSRMKEREEHGRDHSRCIIFKQSAAVLPSRVRLQNNDRAKVLGEIPAVVLHRRTNSPPCELHQQLCITGTEAKPKQSQKNPQEPTTPRESELFAVQSKGR